MNFATIMKYLEQGFTLEQIEQMKTANEKNTAQAASGTGAQAASGTGAQAASGTGAQAASGAAQAASDNAAPAWVDGLSKSIEKLTMTMQAQALANTSINAPKDIQAQADEILANIINPTNKKE